MIWRIQEISIWFLSQRLLLFALFLSLFLGVAASCFANCSHFWISLRNVFQAFEMVEITLPEGHKKADAFDARDIERQRFQLFVVQ